MPPKKDSKKDPKKDAKGGSKGKKDAKSSSGGKAKKKKWSKGKVREKLNNARVCLDKCLACVRLCVPARVCLRVPPVVAL